MTRKGKLISKIFGVALVFVVAGVMVEGGVASANKEASSELSLKSTEWGFITRW